MRPLILILPLSLLLASNAGAQSQHPQPAGAQPASRVEVTAPERPFEFWGSDAEWVAGGYKLSNGWRLKVDAASDGIVAQVGKGHPIRLVAVSRDRYVSADGNMSMDFNQGTDGDEMMMSYVPDARSAQVIVATATMAPR